MPDVDLPDQRKAEQARLSGPWTRDLWRVPGEGVGGHKGRIVGPFSETVLCQSCGMICTADHELQAWTSNLDDMTVAGYRHVYLFGDDPGMRDMDGLRFLVRPPGAAATAATASQPEPEAPKPRPPGIPADAVRRSDHQASRTPEARRREYVKRRRAAHRA